MCSLVIAMSHAGCKSPLLNEVLEKVALAVTPPVISAVYPANSSQEIPVNASLSITFSKKIDASTVNASNLPILDSQGATVGGSYSINAATVTFTATGGFQFGAIYTATISPAVLDTDGQPLAEQYSWTFTTSMTLDTSPPSLSGLTFVASDVIIAGSKKWSGVFTVETTVAASDDRAIAQIMLSDNPSLIGGSWITYNAENPVYSITLFAPDGLKHVYGQVKDGAGNLSAIRISEDIYIDITPPEITNFLINDGASATNNNAVDLDIFSIDDEASSGLAQFRYRLQSGDWLPWQDLTIDSGAGQGTADSVNITTSLGESAVLEAQVIDNIGHTSAIFQRSIVYEQTPPTIVDVSWDNASVFPYNGSVLRIIFDEEMNPDSFSGTSFSLVKVSDATPVPGMINLASGNSIQNAAAELWGLELAPNTSYKVALSNTVNDIAGNAIGGSAKNWFFSTGDAADSNPPAGTVSLTDQLGVVKVVVLPSGSTASDSATVELDFSGISDDYNIPYGIKIWGDNDGLHPSEKSFEQDASWLPWSATIAWHLSTGSGTKYILCKLMDSAGNESSSPIQLKLILDNGQVPIIYGVSIDNGATHTNAADRKVDVSIQAEDAHSGIKEMMVSNSAVFTGAVWEAWQPVISEWELPDSDGSKVFYVKVRDHLDQISTTHALSSIILDRVFPEVSFNLQEILVNTDTRLLEGPAGTDLYHITEAFGIDSYSWEQMSGPGILYFNTVSGGGATNDGTELQEPWLRATSEGDYFIKVNVTDYAGNAASAAVPFRWDVTPPGNISNLQVSQYDTSGQPSWSWTSVANADFYRISYEADFDPFIDVYASSFTPNSPLAPDGNKILYVRAQDNAGNASTALNATVHVDTTPPTIAITNSSFIANVVAPSITLDYSAATHVDGSVVDAGSNPSGVASYQWSMISGSGTVTFGSPTAATTTVSASANDEYQLRLRVIDYAGNISDAYFSFLRDTTLPGTPAVTGPDITPSQYPTWYWSSGGGGIGEYRYRLDGGAIIDTTGTSFTGSALSDLTDHTLLVYEKDVANNWSLAGSKTIHVDTEALTPPILSIGDGQPQLRTITSMTWNLYTGAGGTANAYRWQMDGTPGTNWTEVPAELPEPPAAAATVLQAGLSNGAHTLYVQERIDATWQTSKQASHSITVDNIAPSAPALNGTGLTTVTAGRTATPDTTPTWSWATGGGGNGKFRYQVIRLKNANGSADGTVQVSWTAETTSTSYTPAARTEGTYQVQVQERDDAGNWSSIANQLTTVDTTYPTISGVTIRGASHPSDSDYTYTKSASVWVDITGSISGEINSFYSRPVKINIYDYNAYLWGDYPSPFPTATPTATTITTTLPAGDGTKYVYVRLIDEAGNTSAYINDTIIMDLTLPTGTFSINNGSATTPSLSFNMTMTASDNISTASELEVSLYNSTTSTWGSYRPYATSMLSDSTFTASAGSKTAYVQIRDAAGNNLYYLSDSISLEVPVPTYAAKGQFSGGYTYVYYSPVTDPAGGSYVTRYNIYSTSDSSADPNNGDPVTYLYNTTSTSYSYAPIPKGELLYFFVRAYDTDTGGYGPYSATSVLGFSSNVTVVYDAGLDKGEFYADAGRATMLKSLLEDTQGIVADAYVEGSMPAWTVTLLPEDLISSTYSTSGTIYGDPVIITHGSSFSTASTIDGRVRNIAATGKGTIAMGAGGAYYLYRVDQNWATWSLSSVSPTQPSDIDSGNQMLLTATMSAKTAIAVSSESIWYTPLYYTTLYNSYQGSSIAANIFTTNVSRRGVYIASGANPAGGYIYAGDTYASTYFPVVRQGEYCYFGYYEVPDVIRTGQVLFVNLVARMDDF